MILGASTKQEIYWAIAELNLLIGEIKPTLRWKVEPRNNISFIHELICEIEDQIGLE